MRAIAGVVLLFVTIGCRRDEPRQEASSSKAASSATQPVDASRGLDRLATELVAKSACDRLRGQFRALPDLGRVSDPAGTAAGTWIRDCVYVADGDKVSFTVAGIAWRKAAKATVAVEFSWQTSGRLKVWYAGPEHTVTAAYEPSLPDSFVVLPTLGNSQIGAALEGELASAIAMGLAAPAGALVLPNDTMSPRHGIRVTLPMCTGIPTFLFGTDKITQNSGDPHATVEVRSDAPTLFGPLRPDTRDVTVHAIRGRAHVDFLCSDDAAQIAKKFVKSSKMPRLKSLSSKIVRASARISVPEASCRLTMLVRSTSKTRPATISWYVRAAESAAAAEIAPLRCAPQVNDDQLRGVP
jgi:hypothetical protein